MNKPDLIPIDYDPFLERSAPTTEPQREIYTNIMLGDEPANLAYNESVTLKLKGNFNFSAFEKAVRRLIERHEALRATFSKDGMQIFISEYSSPHVFFHDLTPLPVGDRDSKLSHLIAAETTTAFDLRSGPLIRVSVIKISHEKHYVVLTMHHIIGDGWSLGLCMIDLGKFYTSEVTGKPVAMEKADSWVEYAVEEEKYLQSNEHATVEKYWLKQYQGNIPIIELPVSKTRPALRSFPANRIDVPISPAVIQQLKITGARSGASLVNIMTAAFEVFLFHITGQNEIIVGLPAAGQATGDKNNLVGHCVQLLPLRSNVNPQETFSDYLKRRRKQLLNDFENQRYTFGSLIRKLNIPRDPSRIPLVPVSFNIDIGITNDVHFEGLKYDFVTNPRSYENFEWFINCSGSGNELVIECTYNTDLFEKDMMQLRMQEFTEVLKAVAENPSVIIRDVNLLTSHERTLLNDWNNTFKNYELKKNIHCLFEDAARKYPANIAAEFASEKITYDELNKKANVLANHLGSLNIQQGEPVCICLDRSIELIIALLGILKAGAAYIPVDPGFPASRISYMMASSNVRFLISKTETVRNIGVQATDTILLDKNWETKTNGKTGNPQTPSNPYRTAYIIYTSGSTGTPKGVQIPHRALTNLLFSFRDELLFSEIESLLAITTISFDIAGLELFLPLITGAKVVIASKEDAMDATRLMKFFSEKRITVFQATPATYKILQASGWKPPAIMKLLIGGEAVPADLAKYLSQYSRHVWNVYGPTETTIWSTIYKIPQAETGFEQNEIVKIGKPIANTSLFILDDYLKQTPPGIEGEIYIGGDGLSSGYYNQPELTDERFIYTSINSDEVTRIYKTGDKGKFSADGNLEYSGRSDFQVKIRGYRIELGEIETVLRLHTNVTDTVAHVQEDTSGDKKLIAYFVSQKNIEANELKELLREKLPEYMVPSFFVKLDALPMTPNGKINRKALPAPEVTAKETKADDSGVLMQISSTEETLVDIWKEILSIDRVGIHDNFFELGGHSLIGVRLFIEIEKKLGVKLNLQSLFKAPTVSGLAALIDNEESAIEWQPVVALQPHGSRPPLFCIHMHNGNIYRWKVLEKYLPSDQPIYAIQPRALDLKQEPHRNIEEMAQHYVELIKEVQPHGPYHLLGLCYGGMVVFEMALQLQEKGERVAMAAMINNYAPLENQAYYRMRKEFEGFLNLKFSEKINYALQKNMSLGRKIKNKAIELFLKPAATTYTGKKREHEDIRIIHTLALMHYNPKKIYNGDIFVIQAGNEVEDPEFYDNTLGWKRLVKGKIEIAKVAGSNNDTIIEDSLYNSQLSILIKNKLDEVRKHTPEIA